MSGSAALKLWEGKVYFLNRKKDGLCQTSLGPGVIFFIELISENFSTDLAGLFGRLGVDQDDVTVDVVLGS